jgi:hypothetical protein
VLGTCKAAVTAVTAVGVQPNWAVSSIRVVKPSDTKFRENQFSNYRVITCGDTHSESNRQIDFE